jgi:hypothetical protein
LGRPTGRSAWLADCRHPQRQARGGEHRAHGHNLVGQPLFAIALGYADLNDHDELPHDSDGGTGRQIEGATQAVRAGGREVLAARTAANDDDVVTSLTYVLPRLRRTSWRSVVTDRSPRYAPEAPNLRAPRRIPPSTDVCTHVRTHYHTGCAGQKALECQEGHQSIGVSGRLSDLLTHRRLAERAGFEYPHFLAGIRHLQ